MREFLFFYFLKFSMKTIFLFIIVLFFSSAAIAQNDNPKYDQALAESLGADQMGMKKYVMVLLKTGENQTTDKVFKDSCFAGHMKNIQKLVVDKKLVIAGPFVKNEAQLRGIFILNVTTIAEAKILLETDPAIKEKLLEPELYLWYGSAAISEYLDAADKIWKTKP